MSAGTPTFKVSVETVGIVAIAVKHLTSSPRVMGTKCAPVRIGWASPGPNSSPWHSACSPFTVESRVSPSLRTRVA
jgi:hypothetical protein